MLDFAGFTIFNDMKVFICGPVPEDREKFVYLYSHWENQLKKVGIDPISAHNLALDTSDIKNLPELFMELGECRSIFIINHWKDSKMTRALILWAIELKMTIYYEHQYEILELFFLV